MRSENWFGLLLAVALVSSSRAETIQTLDLKPFVGKTPLDKMGGSQLLPRGRQVIDGIPFQIDGAFMLRADRGRDGEKGRSNSLPVNVGRSFECLHLLTTTPPKGEDSTVLGRFELRYADGTSATIKVNYGVHVRHWFGPWHKSDVPLGDPNSREVLRTLCSDAATSDAYFRFFHVVLTNPFPAKEVRTIVMERKPNQAALLLAAMSVGPAKNPNPQPDTVKPPKTPLPDLRPRSGELARGEGFVRSESGESIVNARVRIRGVRKFAEDKSESPVGDSVVGTEVVTGADGRFRFPPLPDNRLYKLLVFAEKFEPFRYGGLDPKSDPIEVRLKPVGPPGKFAVRAKLVGLEGKPVVGATVETEGVAIGTGRSWGSREGFPEQVISDLNGEFMLSRNTKFTSVQLNITASGLAPEKLWLDASNVVQTIEMGVGATLKGRVLKDGKPLANVKVGVSGANRSSDVYAGHYETSADKDGVFAFEQLPPATAWYFYGIISSLKAHGAIGPQSVRSPDHGHTNELGDIEVKPGLRLAGRVKTAEGEPLPKGLNVRVGSDKAWDSQSARVNEAGEFEFDGLYSGALEVSIDQRDWHLSAINRSLELWNEWRLNGLLERDKNDLLLVIEKGRYEYHGTTGNGQLPPQDQPQGRPLMGAEPGGPPPIVLAGQVLDDKTGERVKSYRIIPGYKPPVMGTGPAPKPVLKQLLEPFSRKPVPWNELPFWRFSLAKWYTNKDFSMGFVPLSSSPILRIESPDYLPFETSPTNVTTTNFVIRLKRGVGPNGMVLQPDGKPAVGAIVLYGASREQFGLREKELMDYGHSDAKQVTDKEGKFSFSARAQGQALFVSHPAGWAEESPLRVNDNLKLHLRPWAVLVGTLVDTNGAPKAGVEMAFTMPMDWNRGDPHVNVNGQIVTDAKGQFEFTGVPPRRVEVSRVIRSAPFSGWSYQKQTWLVAEPGTNNLGNVTYDKPPPEPMFEQIKRSLGL